ncbi:hypothetical protein NQZ68_002876 [Dissostichus eleginoides]|nr:hypothetical protein NQZ68_002876 [Dissostichus eleginoides]
MRPQLSPSNQGTMSSKETEWLEQRAGYSLEMEGGMVAEGLRAHYHSLGLIRASRPQVFYKPERMEKFIEEGRGMGKESSYRAARAPVSLRPPPAESSFEVIIGLLVNAPLQVPVAPSPSLSPSTAT